MGKFLLVFLMLMPLAEASRPTETPPLADVALWNALSSLRDYQNVLEHVTSDPRGTRLGSSGYHVWATFGGSEYVCVNVGHGPTTSPTTDWVCHGLAPASTASSGSAGWFPHPYQCGAGLGGGVADFNTNTIDDATDQTGYLFLAPKTGTISSVGFRTDVVVTAGISTLTVRLETISATTGLPTGTLCGASTSSTQDVANTDSKKWFQVTLSSGCSVTEGDPLAIVIGGSGSTLTGTIFMSTNVILAGLDNLFPHTVDNQNGAGWAQDGESGASVALVGYSDGSYPNTGFYPYVSVESELFTTATSPDEIGDVITSTQDVGVIGAWVMAFGNIVSAKDFEILLYDSDGSTVLEQVSLPEFLAGDTFLNVHDAYLVYFSQKRTLTAGQTYRLTMRPTTSSDTTRLCQVWVDNAAYFQATFGNSGTVIRTERTDAGAWTQTTTKRACLGFITANPQ